MSVDFNDPNIKRIMEILREELNKGFLVGQSDIERAFRVDKETSFEIFVQMVMESRAKPRKEEEVRKREAPLPFKLYFVTPNSKVDRAAELQKAFKGTEGVEVLGEDSLAHALESHPDVDCLICPASCPGGSIEIRDYLGENDSWMFKENLDGTYPGWGFGPTCVNEVLNGRLRLIRTRISPYEGPVGVYTVRECLNLSLKTALDIGAKSALVFDFCARTWRCLPESLAKAMRQGYDRDFALLKDKEAQYKACESDICMA